MLWKWETKAGVRGLGTSQWSAQLQHAQSPLGRARRCSVGVSLAHLQGAHRETADRRGATVWYAMWGFICLA